MQNGDEGKGRKIEPSTMAIYEFDINTEFFMFDIIFHTLRIYIVVAESFNVFLSFSCVSDIYNIM